MYIGIPEEQGKILTSIHYSGMVLKLSSALVWKVMNGQLMNSAFRNYSYSDLHLQTKNR